MDDTEKSAITASLALSLLRNACNPSDSFVISPFSLNIAMSIVHDGADGDTQKELTDLLLKGCSPEAVTEYYSALALSLPKTDKSGVSFKSATRFYLDKTFALLEDYQKHVEKKYNVQVQTLDFKCREEAAKVMNKFVAEATNNKIETIIEAHEIKKNSVAFLINAIHILAKWKKPFSASLTHNELFKGRDGSRTIQFMQNTSTYRANTSNDIGTCLIVPYQADKYSFFYLMPDEASSLEKTIDALTGDKLLDVLNHAKEDEYKITVPKFKVECEIDGVELLQKMGVESIFDVNRADLSKISKCPPVYVDKIKHKVFIEVDEEGTEAAAATLVAIGRSCALIPKPIPAIKIDRPFIYGILRDDCILFLGQYV